MESRCRRAVAATTGHRVYMARARVGREGNADFIHSASPPPRLRAVSHCPSAVVAIKAKKGWRWRGSGIERLSRVMPPHQLHRGNGRRQGREPLVLLPFESQLRLPAPPG